MTVATPGSFADHQRALLAVLLPFARDRIAEDGDFYPFGATMLPGGELQTAATWQGDGEPSVEDVLDAVRADLRARADRGELLATGVVAGVTIDDGGHALGIRVELEHRDAGPVTWVIPYRSDDDRYEEGEPFTIAATRLIWE